LEDSQQSVELERGSDGYFAGFLPQARAGMRYRFRLDGESSLYPDPASRFQPDGPHGSSQIVDSGQFRWTDREWRGVQLAGAIIYEMHIGTFTAAGTWKAAAEQLPELADLGVTILEVMPVAEFPGKFGWGYDGVCLFAPTRLYGEPDDFRRFVDQAHAAGLGVILDVVYNHFGPDGNYLKQFAPAYFTDRHQNEWGEAINFDGPDAGPVREFFVANAAYWMREFHLDGLRLDATQQIFDQSPVHILSELKRVARQAAGNRRIVVVAENELQEFRLVRSPERGGYGIDALWNDDFHHSAHVALTAQNTAYYTDFRGGPQEFISAAKWGYLYQGQYYSWQSKPRGAPALDLRPEQFVTFLENHDQVANSGRGERIHQLSNPGRYRALTALLLLGPGTPMLFQGQEFAASAPFLYFADHEPKLVEQVFSGRKKFLAQFPELARPEVQATLANPSDPATFERCRLNFAERQINARLYAMHRDLLKLRRDDPLLSAPTPRGVDGAVLGPQAFLLRYFASDGMDRLLLVNLGSELSLHIVPEPLLAAPADSSWEMLWSSEDVRYGGSGTSPVETADGWRLPAEAAIFLTARAR
jgi:maltooligosyltrehalose trehalohydrolase